MVFGKCDEEVNVYFNNALLKISSHYKYLGVIFNPVTRQNGNIFKQMSKYVSEKGLKASFVTMKKCSAVGHVTPKVAINLFDACVSPILNYASEL